VKNCVTDCAEQGGRYQMAPEEQRRQAGTRDSIGERTHFLRGMAPVRLHWPPKLVPLFSATEIWQAVANAHLDRQNWLSSRRQRVRGPGGSQSILLPRAGSQGVGLLLDLAALQGTLRPTVRTRGSWKGVGKPACVGVISGADRYVCDADQADLGQRCATIGQWSSPRSEVLAGKVCQSTGAMNVALLQGINDERAEQCRGRVSPASRG